MLYSSHLQILTRDQQVSDRVSVHALGRCHGITVSHPPPPKAVSVALLATSSLANYLFVKGSLRLRSLSFAIKT